jgi:REP element-mobilizing transposase RayT
VARRIRFIPPVSLVEVTCRTVQGRFLLGPSARIAELCRGTLARSARLYPVEVHAFVFLGNHFHLLLTVESAERLAAFMNHLNSNLAREIGRAVGWREKFWGRRYQAVLVSNEEAAQVDRLLYVLRHGCKENLVRSPGEWLGATSIRSLLSGEPVRGPWVDRSTAYRASRKGLTLAHRDFVSSESLELAPLPSWRHLPTAAYRKRIAELVAQVEDEAERKIRQTGKEPLGNVRILQQQPHQAPNRMKKGPAPLVHAASSEVRSFFKEAYRAFVAAFRRASERFRLGPWLPGLRDLFPLGSFTPPAALVSAHAPTGPT